MATTIKELDKETITFFEYFEKVMLNNADIYHAFPVKVISPDKNILRFEYGVNQKKTVIEMSVGHSGTI
jgi:hypothetical protein